MNIKVNDSEVRFSLKQFPDLQIIGERAARSSERGALVREVRRLLRLALLAEAAGITEDKLLAGVGNLALQAVSPVPVAAPAPASTTRKRETALAQEPAVEPAASKVAATPQPQPAESPVKASESQQELASSAMTSTSMPEAAPVIQPISEGSGDKTASKKGINSFLA